MTTQIKGATVRFALDGNGGAKWVQFNRYGQAVASVPRASLIEAVERELNVIVIDKADLPEVQGVGGTGRYFFSDGTQLADTHALDPQWHALRWLAIAEHKKAHPPVDEADVEALAEVLYEATSDPNDIEVPAVARRLLATGKVKVER